VISFSDHTRTWLIAAELGAALRGAACGLLKPAISVYDGGASHVNFRLLATHRLAIDAFCMMENDGVRGDLKRNGVPHANQC